MTKYNVGHQLVAPHMHRANMAERAIQTFKSRFKAGLATVDPKFPVSQWDYLLPQAFLTLNLLQSSRFNPKMSAYKYMHGTVFLISPPLHLRPRHQSSGTSEARARCNLGFPR